jgi:class 3 adenylate cyclase
VTRLQRRNLAAPDKTRVLGRGRLELVELGDVAVGRVTYPPGWRWSDDLGPIVGTASCEVHHIGFVLSGRLIVEMTDGSTIELRPEDVFEIPPGHDAWVVGDEPWVAIDSLGRRYFGLASDSDGDRAFGTILFTDIVGSTEVAARIGDRAWRALLAELTTAGRRELERYRGREVDTTGDGIFALFDSPSRAVRAGLGLVRAAGALGLRLRVGVHTGEYEKAGADVRGLAVHTAARVMASAGPDEVRVTVATAGLLGGSDIRLRSLGAFELKGVPGEVELLAVEPQDAPVPSGG